MLYLMSIDEILEKTKEKVDNIQDPDLRKKLQRKIGKFPKANDPNWMIQSSLCGLSLPATATEKEIEDKICEYLDEEAKNEDYFYAGTKDPIIRKKIYDKKIEEHKQMLSYYCYKGSILSHDENEQLVQFGLFGNRNNYAGEIGISYRESNCLCCDELKKLDELRDKYEKSNIFTKKKNLKNWEKASKDLYQNITDPYFEFDGFRFNSNNNFCDYDANSTLIWNDNKVAINRSHDVNEYAFIDKAGKTTKYVRKAETEINMKNIEGKITADQPKKKIREEILTCDDGINVKRELNQKIVTILNEDKDVKHEKIIGKKSADEALKLETFIENKDAFVKVVDDRAFYMEQDHSNDNAVSVKEDNNTKFL